MTPEDGSPPAARSGFIPTAGRSLTVFLVDDDAEFREMAVSVLSDDGYEVTSAGDGGEALERLSAMADAHLPMPDVLVLDFVLPRLSGLGVLKALKRIGRLPPTLIMTGFRDRSVETFAKNLGALRVLRKPVDGEALCAAVGEAARSRAQESGLREPLTKARD
jgi:CheY-like chemotaxis protein